jgi:hypothetical protein
MMPTSSMIEVWFDARCMRARQDAFVEVASVRYSRKWAISMSRSRLVEDWCDARCMRARQDVSVEVASVRCSRTAAWVPSTCTWHEHEETEACHD